MSTEIKAPKGIICIKPNEAWKKFARGKSWGWDKVANDPDFPKPIYLSPGAPVFIEQQLDDYILSRPNAKAGA